MNFDPMKVEIGDEIASNVNFGHFKSTNRNGCGLDDVHCTMFLPEFIKLAITY